MSKDKAFYNAQLLSLKYETEVVVYQDGLNDFDAVLLSQYDGNITEIIATFIEGYVLE